MEPILFSQHLTTCVILLLVAAVIFLVHALVIGYVTDLTRWIVLFAVFSAIVAFLVISMQPTGSVIHFVIAGFLMLVNASLYEKLKPGYIR